MLSIGGVFMGKVVLFKFKGVKSMVTIFDVAKTFLTLESMTHKKLQKLCYYAQAWHLALYKMPLIDCKFQAWIHGPVCPELYQLYKNNGWNDIPKETNVPTSINTHQYEFIQEVYNSYGEYSGYDLEVLTHMEEPWKISRQGLDDLTPSVNEIDEKIMQKYYWEEYEKSQGV